MWGVGLIAYMLFHSDYMFSDHDQTEWCLNDLNCSIDFLKFMHELVQRDKSKRPFPDQLNMNPYFSVDLKKVITIEKVMPRM